ncbi:MAG: hypothetical protein CM15mV46_570 [Caudoviricetes sp.]|nr:MAG: hypothetical protein CM15mV46_570 [Caudoviricetes sp.]
MTAVEPKLVTKDAQGDCVTRAVAIAAELAIQASL